MRCFSYELPASTTLLTQLFVTGTYKLSGTATFLNLSIVNATLFKGYGLVTDSTYINTTNAFDAEVYATQVLNAFISSSGKCELRQSSNS